MVAVVYTRFGVARGGLGIGTSIGTIVSYESSSVSDLASFDASQSTVDQSFSSGSCAVALGDEL